MYFLINIRHYVFNTRLFSFYKFSHNNVSFIITLGFLFCFGVGGFFFVCLFLFYFGFLVFWGVFCGFVLGFFQFFEVFL